MSGYWEIEAAVSPAAIRIDGTEELLVRVQIVDLEDPDPSATAFIDLRSTHARRIALEILAAADDADWQTKQTRLPGADTMIAQHPHPATAPCTPPAVPADARALAARLAALFKTDSEIVATLNDAHDRLAAANDRLWADRTVDPVRVHEQIHRAFCAYQDAAEQRRQLGFDVGELAQQLADVLTNAGHSPEQARSANVHELAAGTWQPNHDAKESER